MGDAKYELLTFVIVGNFQLVIRGKVGQFDTLDDVQVIDIDIFEAEVAQVEEIEVIAEIRHVTRCQRR